MTDFADEASERTERQIEAALSKRMPEGPKPTGFCHECGEELPWRTMSMCADSQDLQMARRWCDAQCRDDWERRNGRG